MRVNNEETIQKTIQKLIELVDAEKLSVIVGAGFSKNASPKFLNWKELLEDMIIEIYGLTVRQSLEYGKVRGSHTEKQFWKNFINQTINEKGYLPIASEYVKRHGYREVIDEYIEARTPLAIESEGKFYAELRNNEREEIDLTVHEQLLAVNWNNVYTFNYDNLLDIVGGTEKHKELEKQKNELTEIITAIHSRLQEIEKELNTLNNEEQKAKSFQKDAFGEDENTGNIDVTTNDENSVLVKDKESLRGERKKLIDKRNTIKRNIESIDNEQEKLYQPVHNSFEISLRKEQNIIKLHGTIRHADDKTYGFDSDPRCHYVITSEDYEKYPEKHEAFVNLMRIALLQDSFCLIGFSGDDPNFTSWLSWVRDILDRRGREDKEEKIFFIDVSGQPLSQSKKLFFNNHYIKHVPLFDDPLKATPERIKSELIALFKRLSRETIAIKAVQQYRNFWQNYELNPPKGDKSYLYGHKRTQIREVWDNRSFSRLARLESDYTGKKLRLIRGLDRIISKGQIDEDTAKLLVIAFKGDFIPLDVGIALDKFDALRDLLKPYPEISQEFELLYIRSLNLTGRNISDFISNNTSDAKIYESIINAAFRLDFTLMSERLDNWSPVELRWKSGKIALSSYFNLEIDTTYSDIEKAGVTNIQEYRYFLDTILQVTVATEWIDKNDEFYSTHDKKRETLSQELNKLNDNPNYLIKKLSEDKVDISPRGRTSRTRHMGGDMPLKYSIQFLQVIIEIGLPLQKRHVTLIKKQDWYRAFKNIYIRYPYPCLFYSLQYGDDEKFMEEIAEDYVYSNELSPIHNEILSCCLKAYSMPETPINIKQGVLSFTPLFFKKIPALSWRPEFEKIVRTFDLSNRDPNRKRLDPPYGFLYAGLLYTSSQVYKVQFINKILSSGNQIDHIGNHLLIAAKKNLSEKYKHRVKVSLIDQLIDIANQVSQYFVIFNLHDLLSSLQKEEVINKLIQFDFKNCNEGGMFEASSSFSQQNPLLSSKIESGITINNLLWHNGISYENGRKIIGYGSNFIRVSKIQEHVNFSKSTILILYDKLKESVYDIKLVIDEERDLFIFQSYWARLLIEMQLFLRNNQSTLKVEKEFNIICRFVEDTYYQLNKTESIMSLLISDDDYKVREGIQKLVFEVNIFGVQKFIPEYLVIVNRIASKASPGLNNSINNFASVMQYLHKDIDKELFKPFLINPTLTPSGCICL